MRVRCKSDSTYSLVSMGAIYDVENIKYNCCDLKSACLTLCGIYYSHYDLAQFEIIKEKAFVI